MSPGIATVPEIVTTPRTALVPELKTTPRSQIRTESDAIAVSSTAPSIRIETTGPRAITIGKPADFTLNISNLNDEIARDVTIAVRLPNWIDVAGNRASVGAVRQHSADDGTKPVVWSIERLAGRAGAQLALNVIARENQPVDLLVDWSFTPSSASARIIVQEPRLEMAISGPPDVLYGETKTYTITVSNPGTGDAENVIVNLPAILGGGQRTIGTVLAGQQQQLEVSLTAKQSGEIAIQAQATADGGLQSEAVQRVLIRRAALAIETKGPRFKYAANMAKYQIRIANVGDAIAEDVIAAVALPTGSQYVDGLQGAEKVEQGLRWSIGQLSPGSERQYEVTCVLNQDGQNEFHAGARAADELAASDTVMTQVEALADLKLTVEEPQGPQPVGEDVVYNINVTNRGTKGARQVQIVMQFSDGIEPASVDGTQAQLAPGQVMFQPISNIDAGQEAILKVTARAMQPGIHVFRVVVTCKEPDTRDVAEGTTRFFGDSQPVTADQSNSQVFQR